MDEQRSRGSPFSSLGRSLLPGRRDQAHSMDNADWDPDLDAFQKYVAELLASLSVAPDEELLSLAWIQSLLDTFLSCLDRFHAVVLKNRGSLSRPPLNRIATEFFSRAVKALDFCNAMRDGVEQLRRWAKHLDIVLEALAGEGNPITEAQFRRAKKALTDSMLDEKVYDLGAQLDKRYLSLGRNTNLQKDNKSRQAGHSRSFSWTVSRTWSAARELQAMSSSIVAPRSSEISATNGMAVLVYTMSSVLLFVLWALVVAIPFQDRGLQVNFSIPRNYVWAASISSMHERILAASRRREQNSSNGLLREAQRVGNTARNLMELMDANEQFPVAEETVLVIRQEVDEIANVGAAMKDGLNLLERKARDMFRRISSCRTEGLDCLGNAASSSK